MNAAFKTLCALGSTRAAALALAFMPATPWAQAPTPPAAASQAADIATLLQSAKRLGAGRVTAWRLGTNTLVALPASAIGKPLLWYSEVVRVPAGAVTADRGLQVSSLLARFERVDNIVHVRDLSTTQRRRAGAARGDTAPPVDPSTGVPGVPGAPAGTRRCGRSTWP